MTVSKRSIFAAGLALALPFGLTACGGEEKPSREAVHEGVVEVLGQQLSAMEVTAEQIEQAGLGPALESFYTCVTDGIYDDVSVGTLEKIAEGDQGASVEDEDYATLDTVSQTCVQTELEPAMP